MRYSMSQKGAFPQARQASAMTQPFGGIWGEFRALGKKSYGFFLHRQRKWFYIRGKMPLNLFRKR